ncbi:hypothetical protein COU54_02185 [Candidatus Pacearchaeota archaeon CG10_big_fil_rev_8_21_14_0_10_31_24]|nr:MAG: hypothetical protein COU54_02185 [Candidatus Pacearchaeota archaeon CG10_big_fil_rev_8_21_14_0_10_31_24]
MEAWWTLYIYELHPTLISFLAGIISEDVLTFVAIMYGGINYPLMWVMIFGFLGVLAQDYFFFFLRKMPMFSKFISNILSSKKKKKKIKFIEDLSGSKLLLSLIISKFIYGTRIPMILLAGHKTKTFWKFSKIDIPALIIWTGIMVPIAWFAGRGFSKALSLIRGFEKLMGFILIFFLVAYLGRYFVKKYFKNKIN